MSNTQEILKTALLGTDKYLPNIKIDANLLEKSTTNDKESDFLRHTNMVLLMEEAGQMLPKTEVELPVCKNEEKNSIPVNKSNLLKSFLQSNDEILLNFFIWHCNKTNQIIPSELVPAILNKALQQIKKSQPLMAICGETGKWLCSLNKNWQVLLENNQEETDWELGSIVVRNKYLTALRKSNPSEAIIHLEKILPKENAQNRLELLECLQTSLSLQDEAFLQSLEKDKSQKVKDFSKQLLVQIKDSSLNKMALSTLRQFFSIKEERHLLISKKKVLHFENGYQPDSSFFNLGIEKVCSVKGVNDAEYWAYQVFALIHPIQICKELNITENDMLQLLIKSPSFLTLQNYLIEAIIKFNIESWAIELIQKSESPSIQLLNCIHVLSRKNYYKYYYNNNQVELAIFLMDEHYTEFDLEFANQILALLEKNPYQSYSNFYQNLALYLPISVLPKLKTYLEIEKDDYQYKYFKNQIQEAIRIIETKQIILN